jgi:hypothetical protein
VIGPNTEGVRLDEMVFGRPWWSYSPAPSPAGRLEAWFHYSRAALLQLGAAVPPRTTMRQSCTWGARTFLLVRHGRVVARSHANNAIEASHPVFMAAQMLGGPCLSLPSSRDWRVWSAPILWGRVTAGAWCLMKGCYSPAIECPRCLARFEATHELLRHRRHGRRCRNAPPTEIRKAVYESRTINPSLREPAVLIYQAKAGLRAARRESAQ